MLIQETGGTIRVSNVKTGRPETAPFKLHGIIQDAAIQDAAIQDAAFNAKGTYIVTVSPGAAQVWNAGTGEPIAAWQPDAPLSSAAFEDDVHVIVVTAGSAVRRWHTGANEVVSLPWPRQLQDSTRIALSLDGTHLAAADAQAVAVAVWSLARPDHVVPLTGQRVLPRSFAFCADGIHVVTAASSQDDRSVRIWDARSGQLVTAPLEHPEPLKAAVFSHDCTRVLTTSQGNSVRVWDVATGKPITRPFEHRYLLMSATFNADDTQVITVTRDALVHIWDISPDNDSPAQWAKIARGSPFELRNGALQERPDAAEPALAR